MNPLVILANPWRAAALVAALGMGALSVQLSLVIAHGRAERAELEASAARLREDIERQRAEFEAHAREMEARQRAALDAVTQRYELERAHAIAEERAVADDLRAGNLRLRRHWQAAVATADLSQAVATAAGADDAARLRAEGAGALVRVGAECDARIRALQSAMRVYLAPTAGEGG